MGKTRIIAETGAGQHGVATALACAMLDMPCRVYMGAKDGRTSITKRLPYAFDGRRSDSCTKRFLLIERRVL